MNGKDLFQLSEFETTRKALYRTINPTPLVKSKVFESLFLKAESLQFTGSFKIRAALSQINSIVGTAGEKGIVTSSSGNFAQATAYAAAANGISAKIVMMKSSSPLKVERTRNYGGTVVFCEDRFEAREETVARIVKEEERLVIHPYDHPKVIQGNASVGLEIIDQLPDVQNVVVPISGGGLIGGIAVALKHKKPGVKVWGVQPEGSNATYLSFHKGERTAIASARTLADGLMVTMPGKITFPLIQAYVDSVVTVSEDSIVRALHQLFEEEKLVVEPSGAVTLAALLEDKVPLDSTVCVLSGGNISIGQLHQLIGT